MPTKIGDAVFGVKLATLRDCFITHVHHASHLLHSSSAFLSTSITQGQLSAYNVD